MQDWTSHIERMENEIFEAKKWLSENKDVPYTVHNLVVKGAIHTEDRIETYRRWMKEDAENELNKNNEPS